MKTIHSKAIDYSSHTTHKYTHTHTHSLTSTLIRARLDARERLYIIFICVRVSVNVLRLFAYKTVTKTMCA